MNMTQISTTFDEIYCTHSVESTLINTKLQNLTTHASFHQTCSYLLPFKVSLAFPIRIKMLFNVISYFGCFHLLHKQAQTHPHASQPAGRIHLCYQATSLSYQNKMSRER